MFTGVFGVRKLNSSSVYNIIMADTVGGASRRPRVLARELGGARMEDTPAGGLIVRGVKLLATGTWTDSNIRTPLEYTAEALRASAQNWSDRSLWSRHLGGAPRSITERVGMIVNPRYEGDAVVGDLHLHGLTQNSRDSIAMLRAASRGELPPYYVSVEHYSDDVSGPDGRLMATNIEFVGAALVNLGACAKCRINSAVDSAVNTEGVGRELGYVPDNPKGYGKAPEDEPWSAPTLRDFGYDSWPDDDGARRKIASCYAYVTTLDSFSGLKLPHHKPDGTVVWRGVVAALQRLDQTQDVDRAAARRHLEAHYKDFNKQLEEVLMTEEQKIVMEIDTMRKELEALKQRLAGLDEARRESAALTEKLSGLTEKLNSVARGVDELRGELRKLEAMPAPAKTTAMAYDSELVVLG